MQEWMLNPYLKFSLLLIGTFGGTALLVQLLKSIPFIRPFIGLKREKKKI